MGLDVPQLLLGLGRLPVGMAQLQLHLVQVCLHLLPDPHGVILAAYFRVQGGLHRLQHPLVVAFHLLDLLLLLRQPAINFSFDLSELQLDAQNFGLLMFQ